VAARFESSPKGVKNVFGSRCPLKIAGGIVGLVAVLVVDFFCAGGIWDEAQRYQSVDLETVAPLVDRA
jgi:hypothetical protein